jgi:hypothetical protein
LPIDRAKAEQFRRQAMGPVGRKYSGEEGERLGPTLAVEHVDTSSRFQSTIFALFTSVVFSSRCAKGLPWRFIL